MAAGAAAGALAGGAGYSASAALTGSKWSLNDFGISVGIGLGAGGVLGGLTSPHLMPYLQGGETFTGVPVQPEALTVSWVGEETREVDVPDQQAQTLVIGKLNDIQNLGPEEYNLLDKLPDLGNPQDNWYQNASALREEMANGAPIRDASPYIELRVGPPSFLDAERNVLINHGWSYDSDTKYWIPPQR
jgi:hypothetical protein